MINQGIKPPEPLDWWKNQRCRATVPVWDGNDGIEKMQELWGFAVAIKGYDWEDQDYIVFYTVRLDDGTYLVGIYEEDIYWCGWYASEDYSAEYATLRR